jgi:hypothetical protein
MVQLQSVVAMTTSRPTLCLSAMGLMLLAASAAAQPARADYERALTLRERHEALVTGAPDPATWIDGTQRFWYRRSLNDGFEFVVMDAATRAKRAAFDHALLAAELAQEISPTARAHRLPFTTFRFVDRERAIEFQVDQRRVRCTLDGYHCTHTEPQAPALEGALRGVSGPVRGPHQPRVDTPRTSPDGTWEALIQNYNLAIRRVGEVATTLLSGDGSEGNFYELRSIAWSPDSTKLAAYRVRAGYRRTVHYVETSPEDQLQPRHWTLQYAKPGDQLDLEQPVIFHVDPVTRFDIANDLFPNPYELSDLVWRKDSRALSFEYNQRGHQVYRIIEVDATTGKARTLLSEEPKTFFYYNGSNDSRSSGKRFRHDLDDGRQVIWMSERDGWNHLYLIDGATGRVVNQVTSGHWPVRHVQKVDEAKRQIWFSAGGRNPAEDPYHHQ